MKHYTVEYRSNMTGEVKKTYVVASSKWDAYDKAVYEIIPQEDGSLPYSAWVSAVTHNNGKYQTFNTFEGKPV